MKTAVEFLECKLNERLHHLSDYRIRIKEFVRTAKCAEIRKILEVIHKAKEMEIQQKEADYRSGYLDCYTKLMSERLTRDV